MSTERRNRRRNHGEQQPLIIREACAIVDEQVQLVLMNNKGNMNDINITPRAYPLEVKEEVAKNLNWACGMALEKNEITGRFTLGKIEGGDDADAFIYLKDNS